MIDKPADNRQKRTACPASLSPKAPAGSTKAAPNPGPNPGPQAISRKAAPIFAAAKIT